MLWLTWRQHRAELISALLLLAALAVPLIVTGLDLRADYTSSGVAECVAEGRGCGGLVERFLDRHTEWGNRFVWASFLPALAGVFIGAPLFAREFEQGTWRLAVTQTVPRGRWLTIKIALVGTGVVGVAGLCAVLFTWWRTPLDEIGGRMRTAAFVVAAPSLMAVTLFAFAVGVLAGAVLRRTIPAMVATLITYLSVRITTEESIRPHYRTPLSRTTDPAAESGEADRLPTTDWTVDESWVDRTGHRLTDGEQTDLLNTIYRGGDVPDDVVANYLATHGMRQYTEYHPAGSFWTFQAIEAAGFLALAAALLGTTVWLVRRRIT